MTREEYQAKYGVPPSAVSSSTINTDFSLPQMTRQEYQIKYGVPPGIVPRVETSSVPGAETALAPAKPLQTTQTLQAVKIIPNIAKDVFDIAKDLTVGTAQRLFSIPGEVSGLVKESGGVKSAFKNLQNVLPSSAAKVAYGLVPQSLKEIGGEKALIDIPSEFQALVKESGGYASAFKLLAQSVPGSLSETGTQYLNQIDRAGQAFINHPLVESLGYLGLKELGTNPQGVLSETKKAVNTTAEFATKPISSLKDVGRELARDAIKTKDVLRNKQVENIIANREQAIFDIEKNYVKTRRSLEFSKDAGAASRRRIAETDVLFGAVDIDGTIRTKQPGGAIEQYRKQTIDGVEGIVRQVLEKEDKIMNLSEVQKALKVEIEKSGLEGADLVAALSGIKKEMAGLGKRANVLGDIPVVKIHDAKINTTKNINYQTPPETATYRKAVARAYRKLVEERSAYAKEINPELKKYLTDIQLLENLDGRKVKGGKLGKYFAQVTGNIAGGAVGGAVGGPLGTGIGTVVGGEVARAVKGRTMAGTFGKETGRVAPPSDILKKASDFLKEEIKINKQGKLFEETTASKEVNNQIVYRASPLGFPTDIWRKGTYFAPTEQLARYYSESHLPQGADPSSIKVIKTTLPKTLLNKTNGGNSFTLKSDFPVKSQLTPIQKKQSMVTPVTQKPTRIKPEITKKIDITKDEQVNVLTELEIAEAGERVYIPRDMEARYGEPGNEARFIARHSTFPKWIPEELRRKPLLDAVLEHINNDTLPTKADEVRLYNVVAERMGIVQKAQREVTDDLDIESLDFFNDSPEKQIKAIDSLTKKYEQEVRDIEN